MVKLLNLRELKIIGFTVNHKRRGFALYLNVHISVVSKYLWLVSFFAYHTHTHTCTHAHQSFQEKWSALYDVRTILLSIQSLLAGIAVCWLCVVKKCVFNVIYVFMISEPNNESPLNAEASQMWEHQDGKN